MYTYFSLKRESGRPRRELHLLLSSPFFCETEKPENCWCSRLRMKSMVFEWSWLRGQSSLIFISGDICFPETNKTTFVTHSVYSLWSLTAVMTLAVLSAAPQLCSTCRTGILPRWSRHRMSRELCMCSFWKRRLTFCFLKSCGLTQLVCFGSCLLMSELCRHLANTAPGNSVWRPSVYHLVPSSFLKDIVEDST